MAKEPEEGDFHLHDEGGPVKSFLEHLEDLRWTLVKCAAVVAVAVLVCLLAGNHVVAILVRPLQKATIKYPGTNQVVTLLFGKNRLATYALDAAQEEQFNLDPNRNALNFSAVDVIDLQSLARKLKQPAAKDAVSQYLSGRLAPETHKLLDGYPAGTDSPWEGASRLLGFYHSATNAALQQALADDLNRVIQSGPVYDAVRFKDVKLSPAAKDLLALPPQQGLASVRLNQQLLLSAYPRELSKEHNRYFALQVVPVAGTNSPSVLGFQVDTNADAMALATHMNTSINALGPAKAFLIGFHVAVYAGVAMASPFLLLFIGQFVLPALRIKERKYLYRGLAFAIPLFLCGVSFCYFILLPAALAASQLYSDWFGFSSAVWDAGDYIGFVCKFMLGMGLGFELPVVILVLVKIGLLSYRALAKARPYMIVINLVLGAVLTTPEVFTQVLMAIPLQVLFEISVWIAWYWERKERKRQAAEEAGA
jgi:Tat protein translocase TatC